jgi:hypothetical protein
MHLWEVPGHPRYLYLSYIKNVVHGGAVGEVEKHGEKGKSAPTREEEENHPYHYPSGFQPTEGHPAWLIDIF